MAVPFENNNAILVSIRPSQRLLDLVLPLQCELCIVLYSCSKTNQMHKFLKILFYFGITLHVSDGLSVHHVEFKTVHTAIDMCQSDTVVCLLAGTRWNSIPSLGMLLPYIITAKELHVIRRLLTDLAWGQFQKVWDRIACFVQEL